MVFPSPQRFNMLPTAGLCTSICQCHQRNLFINENRPVAGNGEAEWLHAAMCTCTGVVHNFSNSHGLLLRLYGFWCIGMLVNVYWIPWKEL